MYLVSVCKGGGTLPTALPPSITPPLAADTASTAAVDNTWVVTNELKAKYDTYFAGIDKDLDGFVSGEEVRPLFIASKVPQPTLAHIWWVWLPPVLHFVHGCGCILQDTV